MATKEEIDFAKHENPTQALQSLGFTVKGKGRNIEVFDSPSSQKELYRITQKSDGKWVACDYHANGIGDNIALIQQITGNNFAQAIETLAGRNTVTRDMTPKAPEPEKYPTMPMGSTSDRIADRDYLKDLGINHLVLDEAEKQGFLKYTRDRVMYVGNDTAGQVRNVTTRAIRDDIETPKRDLANTNKAHPQILEGKSSTLWIVEGGKDALAVHTLAKLNGRDTPTVIVTGGVGTKACFENPAVRNLINRSDRIVYALENESTPEKQLETDARRQAQIDLIASAKRPDVQIEKWAPAAAKDVAHHLELIHKERVKEQQISRDKGVGRELAR
jgi:hypothetical protein